MFFQHLKMTAILAFRLLYVFGQLLYGAWKISTLKGPAISIFGGARMKQDDKYALMANDMAHLLVLNGISVLTGSGPGIMQAASCGAVRPKNTYGKSIGIGVKDLGEGRNVCVQKYFELNYFFARKWLLTNYSIGFIVFPGGFGTMDELTEVLTLIQTKKLDRVPIILIGQEYWAPFMKWVTDEALKHGLVSMQDLELFTVTDSLALTLSLIKTTCNIE